MSFLDFFKKKSVTQMDIQKMCEIGRPQLGTPYSDKKSVDMYRSWVYIASTHNAKNIADGTLSLYSNKKPLASKFKKTYKQKELKEISWQVNEDTVEIIEHPILNLLHRPNENDSLYSFLYKIDLFLELTGDAYVYIMRDGNGIPIQLYVLYSQYINIQTDGQNRVIKYNYGVARNGKWEYSYEPDDIIHFKFFDPSDVLYGISPLEACARSYSLVESMNLNEESLNRNYGVPSGIIKYNSVSQLKKEDKEIMEKQWQQKLGSVGRQGKVIAVGRDVDYQQIGISSREMQYLEGRKISREEIFGCFGVNPALILTDDVNRSNMVTSSINYYHNTLKPRFKLISQTLTNELIYKNSPDGPSVFLVISKESPQDNDVTIQKAKLLSDKGAVTINELRMSLGYEYIDGGDELVKALKEKSNEKEN